MFFSEHTYTTIPDFDIFLKKHCDYGMLLFERGTTSFCMFKFKSLAEAPLIASVPRCDIAFFV